MTTSSYTNQKPLPIVSSITQRARELVKKHPGIYKGNLEYRLLVEIYKSTKIDIELAFIQLLREGYFFSIDDAVYPPNKVDDKTKILTRFVHRNSLSLTDYGILNELDKLKKIRRLSELSRKVVSSAWSEDEREVKIRIQELFREDIITEDHGVPKVNWALIMGS